MTDKGAKKQERENKELIIHVNPKEVFFHLLIENYTDYLDQTLDLIKEGNNKFNIQFSTKDGRRLNSRDFYFFLV